MIKMTKITQLLKKMNSDKVCEDAAAAHKLAFIAQRTWPGGEGRLWSM